MDRRVPRWLGACSAAGAAVAAVASVPSRWYGAPETDAFVFDPAAFSPLWIERTLVPVAAVVAVALLACGPGGLLVRDSAAAGRLRRWGTVGGALGLLLLELPVLAFATTRGAAAGSAVGLLFVLTSLLAGLVGLVVLVVGLLLAGIGYARTDRPRVGYALAGGTALAVLVAVAGTVATLPETWGSLPVAIPLVAPFVVVGHELWTHPEPVSEAADGTDGERAAPEDAGHPGLDDAGLADPGDADGQRATDERGRESEAPGDEGGERDA